MSSGNHEGIESIEGGGEHAGAAARGSAGMGIAGEPAKVTGVDGNSRSSGSVEGLARGSAGTESGPAGVGKFSIRMAQASDAERFFAHVLAHFRESGRDGDPIFHPMMDFEKWDGAEQAEKYRKAWSRPLTELHWERVWILEQDGFIRGHANIQGGRMPGSFHRATYAIGLERSARGQGWGRALTTACLDWARAESSLEWIDLYVFTHNPKAQALYRAFGFKEIGTTEDLFRVHGVSVSDTHMVLRV